MTPALAIIPISGLGSSQLIATRFLWWKYPGLVEYLKGQFPDAVFFDGGGTNEFYNTGVWDFIAKNPSAVFYGIGHSLGVDTTIANALALGASRCIGVTVIDPVNHPKQNPGVPCRSILSGNSLPFIQYPVDGVMPVRIVGTNHNGICHVQQTFDLVTSHINTAIEINKAALGGA